MTACPNCQHTHTQVIDSRPHSIGVIRKRRCMQCIAVFKTIEMPAEAALQSKAFEDRIEEVRKAARDFSSRLDKIGANL